MPGVQEVENGDKKDRVEDGNHVMYLTRGARRERQHSNVSDDLLNTDCYAAEHRRREPALFASFLRKSTAGEARRLINADGYDRGYIETGTGYTWNALSTSPARTAFSV